MIIRRGSAIWTGCEKCAENRFVEWYGTDPCRLKAVKCGKSLEEVRAFIGNGGGHFEDYVTVEPNDDLYTVAYYYLDQP